MSNPSPVLLVEGTVYASEFREVEPAAARPETRDEETGRVTAPALPARAGYTVLDVSILTEHGGFCTLNILPPAHQALGGDVPNKGDAVTFLVRPYVRWDGPVGRKYARVGLSVAGEETAKLREKSGRRVSAVS